MLVQVPESSLLFMYNGRIISNDETPQQLKMEQVDVIEVYQEPNKRTPWKIWQPQ